MFTCTLVGLLVPLAVILVVLVLLISILSTVGVLFGLLWPGLPILIGLALVWRILFGRRR